MSVELEKGNAFVQRLLQNPALKDLTPLQKEEQILYFLQVNQQQLFPTLSSQSFFPGKTWDEIVNILGKALFNIIDMELSPKVASLFQSNIDLSFVQFLRKQNTSIDVLQKTTLEFLSKLLNQPGARRVLAGSYIAIAYRYVDKYIDAAFDRKHYVHFELTKVQKLKMSRKEIKDMINLTLLLKPSIYLFSFPDTVNMDTPNSPMNPSASKRIIIETEKILRFLPPQLIESAIRSNISFQEEDGLEATSRIAAIISAMCKILKPGLKIDKGAEGQEKSWLNTTRRNYKYYGFDVKILDEFYQIAAEKGW